MTLEPQDIERAVFKERFRGYDQTEVDRFLDEVADRIGSLLRERDELAERVRELADRSQQAGEAEGMLRRTLVAAQRTAEETVEEARRQAEEILAEARRRAVRERDQVHAEAELLQRAVEELRRFRADYRARLSGVLSEQLAILDRVGELPRLPAAVEAVLDGDVDRHAGDA